MCYLESILSQPLTPADERPAPVGAVLPCHGDGIAELPDAWLRFPPAYE